MNQETKEKIRRALKGKTKSEEHRKNMSIARKGVKIGPMKQVTKDKIATALIGNKNGKNKNLNNKNALGKVSGKNNGNWKGGISNKEILAGREKTKKCEICFDPCKVVFDHNHRNNKFRGWLCSRCNLVLGMVGDNPSLLRNLAMYIEIHEDKLRPKSILDTLFIPYVQFPNYYRDNKDSQIKKENQSDTGGNIGS